MTYDHLQPKMPLWLKIPMWVVAGMIAAYTLGMLAYAIALAA